MKQRYDRYVVARLLRLMPPAVIDVPPLLSTGAV